MSKPRILLTGMNAAQCRKDYFETQELQVVPSHYSLIRCLEDMGFEVEHRPVLLGEDLTGYAEVIVLIHSIQAFCQRLWGGLYAIGKRADCIIAFDDWQVDQIYHAFEVYLKDLTIPDRTTKPFREYLLELYQGKETPEVIKSFEGVYIDAVKRVLQKDNRLLVSAFAGGDLSRMKLGWKEDRVFRYNPNPYHLNRKRDNGYGTGSNSVLDVVFGAEPKAREWNFASLVHDKTRKWLDAQNPGGWKWPLNIYGARRGKFKSERLTEPEMCMAFERQWGCLMPGYFHSGSGWWRARPLQVADAGSILVCDPEEGMVYGEAYGRVRASDVEAMADFELEALAKAQRESLNDRHPLLRFMQRDELSAALDAPR